MEKINLQDKPGLHGFRAQAIVEFAIVLPVLILIVVGLMEVGRLIVIYAGVTNASREAARYGSVVGRDNGYYKYQYCDGIKDKAIKSAFMIAPADLTITVEYDNGGSAPAVVDTCNGSVDTNVAFVSGVTRVKVTVTAVYRPMVRIVPIPQRVFTSVSARTILGIVDVGN